MFQVSHQTGSDPVALVPTAQGSETKVAFAEMEGKCHFLLVFQLLSDATGMVVEFLPTDMQGTSNWTRHLKFMYGGASMLDANSIFEDSNVLGGPNDISAEVVGRYIYCFCISTR